MKKQSMLVIFTLLALFTVQTQAFATTYECNLLQTGSGARLMGGAEYGVTINHNSVVLDEISGFETGHLNRKHYAMTKTTQEPDGSTYKAEDVTATIFENAFGGRLVTSVSISVLLGDETYTADCLAQNIEQPKPIGPIIR